MPSFDLPPTEPHPPEVTITSRAFAAMDPDDRLYFTATVRRLLGDPSATVGWGDPPSVTNRDINTQSLADRGLLETVEVNDILYHVVTANVLNRFAVAELGRNKIGAVSNHLATFIGSVAAQIQPRPSLLSGMRRFPCFVDDSKALLCLGTERSDPHYRRDWKKVWGIRPWPFVTQVRLIQDPSVRRTMPGYVGKAGGIIGKYTDVLEAGLAQNLG